jgi:hypothetical protein
MKTELNETDQHFGNLIYYGDCDEKGHFYDSRRLGVFIGSFGFLSLF